MLPVGAVVLRELDRIALDVVDLADLRAAGGVDLHVLLDVGGRADGAGALGQRRAGLVGVFGVHGVLRMESPDVGVGSDLCKIRVSPPRREGLGDLLVVVEGHRQRGKGPGLVDVEQRVVAARQDWSGRSCPGARIRGGRPRRSPAGPASRRTVPWLEQQELVLCAAGWSNSSHEPSLASGTSIRSAGASQASPAITLPRCVEKPIKYGVLLSPSLSRSCPILTMPSPAMSVKRASPMWVLCSQTMPRDLGP